MSGTICPKDGTNCPDDVCRGSGVCIVTNSTMGERCDRCGVTFDPEFLDCECPPDDYPDDDDDDDFDPEYGPDFIRQA